MLDATDQARVQPVDRTRQLHLFDPHGTPQCMGEEIAAQRRVLGLSRKALAQQLSIGEGTLACFEEGASKPTGKRAEIVSAFLTT